MKKVLMIGLHPDVVEYSSFPDLTKEKLTMALEARERIFAALASMQGGA